MIENETAFSASLRVTRGKEEKTLSRQLMGDVPLPALARLEARVRLKHITTEPVRGIHSLAWKTTACEGLATANFLRFRPFSCQIPRTDGWEGSFTRRFRVHDVW